MKHTTETRTIHGQTVTVKVYPKGRLRRDYRMTTSNRITKRPAMTMGEKRREGFCK